VLETVSTIYKLLGARTTGGGKRLCRGWGWRELREANKPCSHPIYTKIAPKIRPSPTLMDFKMGKIAFFLTKLLYETYNVFCDAQMNLKKIVT
jgi:hypothetical protein